MFSIALHVLNYDAILIRAPLYFFTGILENGLPLSLYAQRLRKEWQLAVILSIYLGNVEEYLPFAIIYYQVKMSFWDT